MADSSGSRADAAYERARQAYDQHSYDAARRWALEALTQDPHHAGARALLGRLDVVRQRAGPGRPAPSGPARAHESFEATPRRGPEVISTDPTILIGRASGSMPDEPVAPTVMVSRDDPRRPPSPNVRPAAPSPWQSPSRPVVEPTVIVPPKPRQGTARSGSPAGVGSALGSLWQRFRRRDARPKSPWRQPPATPAGASPGRGPGLWTPGLRGVLIAVVAVAAAAALVWGAISAGRWLWPAGQLLTLTKPEGGTIVGPGLYCGSRGSQCTSSRPTGDTVELEAQPDKGFVFSGFTGDCAPSGRTEMSAPRTCGATFDAVAPPQAPVTFRLTITKPTGGSVLAAGGIQCGSLGENCSADLPSGVPVTLRFQADDGFTFSQFTGDCPPNGEMTMTAAMTCGAAFTPVPTARANVTPGPPPPPGPKEPRQPVVKPPAPGPPQLPPVAGPESPQGQQPTSVVTVAPPVPDKPVAAPETPEEHAKKEIQQLVKDYCSQLETLKPERVRKLFHQDNEQDLRNKFREYKSLRCTVTPPEYDRLDADKPAGGAQLKVNMKQSVQMKSGGAPQTVETIVTILVSRADFQSPWLIDRVEHVPKPKP